MSTTRTFIAAPLPPLIVKEAGRLVEDFTRRIASVRWSDPGRLHITLAFLGDVENHRLNDVCQAAVQSALGAAPFDVRLAGLGAFPNFERASVIWLGVADGAPELRRLHDRLETNLEPLGYRPESRAFSPHLTIGRVNRAKRLGPKDLRILNDVEKWSSSAATIEEILVMASELKREGPIYTVLARVPFATSP